MSEIQKHEIVMELSSEELDAVAGGAINLAEKVAFASDKEALFSNSSADGKGADTTTLALNDETFAQAAKAVKID
jgi:hypothetical protein